MSEPVGLAASGSPVSTTSRIERTLPSICAGFVGSCLLLAACAAPVEPLIAEGESEGDLRFVNTARRLPEDEEISTLGFDDDCDGGSCDGDAGFRVDRPAVDRCPDDPRKTTPGQCGCGVAERDDDGDGLANCVETMSGRYVSPRDTGSDPHVADTDGDGISDGDEVLGTARGLDLPALGAHVLRKDIFIHYAWFDDDAEPDSCSGHSHRPTRAAIALIEQAFRDAPIINVDGSQGIFIHQDYGQGAPFSRGGRVDDEDGVIVDDVFGDEFRARKAAALPANRVGYFHFALLVHRYDTDSRSSGEAEMSGDDLMVSLACAYVDARIFASTLMHELGHNLGLDHGGRETCNWKPSYPSVMNYKYQFTGVDTDCRPRGDGIIGYSRGLRPSLDERALDERRGMCGIGPPVDWNGDGRIHSNVRWDLNRRGDQPSDPEDDTGCDATLGVLTDHDDFAALDFGGIRTRVNGTQRSRVVACQPPPP